MSSRRDRITGAIGRNAGAIAAGTAVAVFSGLPILTRVPASVVAGTAGYLVGGWLARRAWRVVARRRLAAPGALVQELHRLPPDGAVTAGGKARNLALLAQAGYPVPKGFVVLTGAFDGDELTRRGAAELAAALSRLGRGPFAVRSSAIAEDSGQASFAGSFDTVLDVGADDVAAAVSKVRASHRAQRVLSYSAPGTSRRPWTWPWLCSACSIPPFRGCCSRFTR